MEVVGGEWEVGFYRAFKGEGCIRISVVCFIVAG